MTIDGGSAMSVHQFAFAMCVRESTYEWRLEIREEESGKLRAWCRDVLCDCLYLWVCGDHVVRVCFLIIIRFISFVFLNQIQSDFQIGSSETWSNHNLIVLAKMKPIGVGQ